MNNKHYTKRVRKETDTAWLTDFLADLHNFTQKYSIHKLEVEGKLPTSRQYIYKKAQTRKEKSA